MTLDSPYDPDTLARIAWATIASPGDRTAALLVHEHGPIDALDRVFRRGDGVADLEEGRLRMRAGGILPASRIATTIAETLSRQLTVVTPASQCWPTGMNALTPAAPFALWMLGNTSALRRPGIMVVGTEQLSPTGLHLCLDYVSRWASLGYAIYSSGENGIATVALLAALAADGSAVSLVSTPHNETPPYSLGRIAPRLVEHGVIVSEVPPGVEGWRMRPERRVLLTLSASDSVVAIEPSEVSCARSVLEIASGLGRRTVVISGEHALRDFTLGPEFTPQSRSGVYTVERAPS